MATDAAVTSRLDRLLHRLEVDLETLPDLVDEDGSARGLHPVVVEWWGWVAEAEAEHQAYETGSMTDEQRARYRQFVRRVRDLLPLIDQFGPDTPKNPL